MTLKKSLIWTIMLGAILGLTACSDGETVQNPQFAFLNNAGITVNEQLLLGDSLVVPDLYCGDPNQTTDDVKGVQISKEQYDSLITPIGNGFPDAMSNWLLLGVRDMGSGITLAAYYAASGVGYCLDLVTYDKYGHVLDAINARELHVVWRVKLTDPNDNNACTLDGYFTFAGNKVILHRVMGRCLMDFDNDVKGTPQWQQAWEQTYTINSKGHFVLDKQQVVGEKGVVDNYATMEFKSWDMLVCSLYDMEIMDSWNDFIALPESVYAPDYPYSPVPQDVNLLYHINPQRFLNWLALPGNRDSRLTRNFKLQPGERPALLEEITRINDPNARQWLNALVNSWDDKPLTKHL